MTRHELEAHRRAVTFAKRAAEVYRERIAKSDAVAEKATLDLSAALAACNDAGVTYRVLEKATGISLRQVHRFATVARDVGMLLPTL